MVTASDQFEAAWSCWGPRWGPQTRNTARTGRSSDAEPAPRRSARHWVDPGSDPPNAGHPPSRSAVLPSRNRPAGPWNWSRTCRAVRLH